MVISLEKQHTDTMPFLSRYSRRPLKWLDEVRNPSNSQIRKKILTWAVVFSSYLLTAQVGVFLYRDIGTSPALIWPPVGIALAATLLEGYWIVSSIAAAALVSAALAGAPPFIIVGSVLANSIQPMAGVYFLRRLRFNMLLSTLRDVFLLIAVTLAVTAIMPLTNVVFAYLYNLISTVDRPIPSWPQIWIGGALSALILTPFLSRWIGHDFMRRTRAQQLEMLFSISLVSVFSYAIFATALPSFLGTSFLLLLLASLFWIAFRVGPRAMFLALLILTSLSLAGALFGVHAPSAQSLSDRLISTEIFDFILAFFFLILVSVEEQRKDTVNALTEDARRLASALETIRAEEKAKNEFIATLAHELRNPLAPIMSGLEILRLDEKIPERIEILESAQRQSMVMRKLLDELLDVARIARNSFKLKKEEVLLQEILREAQASVTYFYKEAGHTLTTSLEEDEMWIHGDPVRLVQIFTNILFNAGKYTDAGGAISLTLRRKNNRAIVTVSDNGIGITKEMLSQIFQPFVQDSHRDVVGTGLGIGLSIAKRLVELHDGTIVAESAGKNKGSTFTIELPLHQRAILENLPPTEAASRPSSILVVDDNRDAAKSIARLLRARGNTVDIVFTGKDALKAIEKKPHYVLLDIGLPDIEGHKVAKEIREREPSAIVIALSGYGSQEDKRKAMEAGIAVHITKPASLADIENALASHGVAT